MNTTSRESILSHITRVATRAVADGVRLMTCLHLPRHARRLVRGCALVAIAAAAAGEFGWCFLGHRGQSATPWRRAWHSRWARHALRALHLRLTLFGHTPARGLLISNDAGPVGRLVIAALGPGLLPPEPDAVEDAIADGFPVTLSMNTDGPAGAVNPNLPILQRAVQRTWPVAAAWIETVPADLWTLLAMPAVSLTVAVARSEPAQGSAATLSNSVRNQVQLLAHAVTRAVDVRIPADDGAGAPVGKRRDVLVEEPA